MKTKLASLVTVCLLAGLAVGVSLTPTRAASADTIADRMYIQKASEVVIWAQPLMNAIAMRDGFEKDGGAGANDLLYFKKPIDWRFQITTPNNTTMYAFAFWKTLEGPMVVEIPPTNPKVDLFGTMMDIWQRPVIDVGGAGFDKGLGGKYLLLPPNYNGPYPKGYFVFPQMTYNGWFALRAIVKDFSPETMAAAETLLKKIRIYPLSKAQNPPAMQHVAADGKLINGVPIFDLALFEQINDLIQVEPAEERDRTAYDMLKYIGIKKGEPFKPTEREKGLLAVAVKEAHEDMMALFTEADPSWRYWPELHWRDIVPFEVVLTEMSWDFPTYTAVTERARFYYGICTSSKQPGAATRYFIGSYDSKGQMLNGSNKYVLHVPPKVPVSQFWSVLAYDTLNSAAFIENMPKPGVSSLDNGLNVNSDGSIDLYFAANPPTGKEANWVPLANGRDFALLFRLYGPQAPLSNKSWKFSDLVQVDSF